MIGQLVTRFASGLRFPALFLLATGLFLLDLLVPDMVPFVDEVLLALLALLAGSIRKRRPARVVSSDQGVGASGEVDADDSSSSPPPTR